MIGYGGSASSSRRVTAKLPTRSRSPWRAVTAYCPSGEPSPIHQIGSPSSSGTWSSIWPSGRLIRTAGGVSSSLDPPADSSTLILTLSLTAIEHGISRGPSSFGDDITRLPSTRNEHEVPEYPEPPPVHSRRARASASGSPSPTNGLFEADPGPAGTAGGWIGWASTGTLRPDSTSSRSASRTDCQRGAVARFPAL